MPEPTIRVTMLAARARTPMARTSPSSVRPGVGGGVVESFTWRMPNGGRRHVPNDGHESDTSRRPPPFQLLPTQTASPRRIAVGPALTTRDRRTRRTPARWRGRHRRPQKGSACGGGLLSQRASFLNERPREASTAIMASRGSSPSKGLVAGGVRDAEQFSAAFCGGAKRGSRAFCGPSLFQARFSAIGASLLSR